MRPSTPPWVFLLLAMPFGAQGGFLTVTLAFGLEKAGVAADAIATLIALSYLPHTWKFAWAPLVDLTWTRRRWYAAATALSAAGVAAMAWWGTDAGHWALLTAAVLVANVAATISGMAAESMMAHGTAEEAKGRAGGWFQAGNLGGQGLGGGLALWLVQGAGLTVPASGAVLGLLCAGCMAGLALVADPGPQAKVGDLPAALRTLWTDLRSVALSRTGALAMAICFLPIGTGAASNLWATIAGDWQAGAGTVALVNGALTGLASAFGCLVGGQLCDRMDRKAAYCLFGALLAALAVAMALWPRTEAAFVGFALVYAVVVGMSYAAFSAVVLEAIGRGAAATKYSLLASLSNVPIAWVTWADGQVYARAGPAAMLHTEAALGLVGLVLFVAAARWRRR